jgi:hypothetical protein
LLDYDVSLHKFIEIFVSFKMSPRLSKTESGCSSYCRLHFGVSASFGGPEKAGLGAEKAGPPGIFVIPSGATFLMGGPDFWSEKVGLGRKKPV